MKKIFLTALVLSLYSWSNVEAASGSINQNNLDMQSLSTSTRGETISPRRLIDEFGNPISGSATTEEGQQICTQSCIGYSTSISQCPDGFELKTCQTPGCFTYHKCEQSPCAYGYDTSYKECPIEVQADNYLCSKCK